MEVTATNCDMNTEKDALHSILLSAMLQRRAQYILAPGILETKQFIA
jgi:hypothetical protein